MTGKRKAVMMVAAVFACALIVIAILYAGLNDRSDRIYRQSIARARLYFAEANYEEAVVHYQRALAENDQSVDAYEGLANTYVAMGDTSRAITTLQNGFRKTKSIYLNDLLQRLLVDSEGGIVNPGADGKAGSEEASLDTVLLSRINGTTYREYREKAEPLSVDVKADGSILVRFAEVPGVMTYTNSSRQPGAVDNGKVTDWALPSEIRLDDISRLVGKTPLTMAELETLDFSSIIKTRNERYEHLIQFVTRGCTVTVECDQDWTIQPGAWHVIVPTGALERAAGGGQAGGVTTLGTIIDVQTGDAVSGISLRFFREDGSSETPVAEDVTDGSGGYEVSLPPGTYTVEMSGDGYVTDYIDIQIGEYASEEEEDFVVTRELGKGQARIVLEWGASPTDLDSHLIGETDSGTSCHVSFRGMSCSDNSGTVADLDLDDMTSYGPETTTVYNLNGKYDFIVHNYSPWTGTLEGSGAEVTLYLPGESPDRFTIGSDGTIDGDQWYVFTLDHGKIERNSVGSASSEIPPSEEETDESDEMTMESWGIPYGHYEGEMPMGDGCFSVKMDLNEDGTFYWEADNFDPLRGTFHISGLDDEGRPILSFSCSHASFDMYWKSDSKELYKEGGGRDIPDFNVMYGSFD